MKKSLLLFLKRSLPILVVAVIVSLIWTSCQENLNEPQVQQQSQVGILNSDNSLIKAAITIQEKHTASLMNIDDVVGTAVGLTDDGKPSLLVFTKVDIYQNALRKGAALVYILTAAVKKYIFKKNLINWLRGQSRKS